MIKQIKLTSPKYGEKIVSIDKEDFILVSKYHWSISFVRGNWYAIHNYTDKGKRFQIKMHRLVMGANNPKIHIDHKDHNGLNNCKSNLRKSTILQNSQNVGATVKSTTGFKGVFLYTKHAMAGNYVVRIMSNGKRIFGGYFKDPIEAAKKYNELAQIHHGEFAFLNPIPNQ